MNLFDRDNTTTIPEDKAPSAGVIALLVAIFFLPSFLAGFIVWSLYRYFRFKRSVIFTCTVLLTLFTVIFWVISGGLPVFLSLIGFNFRHGWVQVLFALLPPAFLLGYAVGLPLTFWKIFQATKRPWLFTYTEHWLYNFRWRRTPLEIWRQHKLEKTLLNGGFERIAEFTPLGIDESTGKLVGRYDSELVRHTLITGAVGSGKTVTMLSMIKNDILSSRPTIVIDNKGGRDFATKMALWAREAGSEFYHFTNIDENEYNIEGSSGQVFYDPLAGATNTSRTDMLMNMREYDKAASVYEGAKLSLLSTMFPLLAAATQEHARLQKIDWKHGWIRKLYTSIDEANLQALCGSFAFNEGTKLSDAQYAQVRELAQQLNKTIYGDKGATASRNALSEMRADLRTLVASSFGKWIAPPDGEKTIDLWRLSNTPGSVVLFSLDSDSEKRFSSLMGALILADLTGVSAKRRNSNVNNIVSVYVDEFQTLSSTSVEGLLEKARESKIGVTLSLQSFDQLIKAENINGKAYCDAIIDTCGNFIAHAGSGHDSAERFSKVVGEEEFTRWSVTKQTEQHFLSINWDNDRNLIARSEQDTRWKVEPKVFQGLEMPGENNKYRSTAIFINKACGEAEYARAGDGVVYRKILVVTQKDVSERKHFIESRQQKNSDLPVDNPVGAIHIIQQSPSNENFEFEPIPVLGDLKKTLSKTIECLENASAETQNPPFSEVDKTAPQPLPDIDDKPAIKKSGFDRIKEQNNNSRKKATS